MNLAERAQGFGVEDLVSGNDLRIGGPKRLSRILSSKPGTSDRQKGKEPEGEIHDDTRRSLSFVILRT